MIAGPRARTYPRGLARLMLRVAPRAREPRGVLGRLCLRAPRGTVVLPPRGPFRPGQKNSEPPLPSARGRLASGGAPAILAVWPRRQLESKLFRASVFGVLLVAGPLCRVAPSSGWTRPARAQFWRWAAPWDSGWSRACCRRHLGPEAVPVGLTGGVRGRASSSGGAG